VILSIVCEKNMQLSKITFRKSDLEQIPEAERVMFISLSHAANELNILSKLFQISMKGPITNELERQVMNVQGLMFARLLAGKLSELWQMFSLVFFKSKISLEFEPLLDTEAGISLVSLKKYFSKSNVINTVRNKCAFHYSLDEISEGYSELDDSRVLDIYLSQSNENANTIYCFADYIANLAMLKSIDAKDSHSAFENFMDDTSNAMKWFNLVLGNCIAIIAKKVFEK